MLDFGSISVPTGSQAGVSRQMYGNEDDYDPKTIRDLLYNNPRERALLKERNPPLSHRGLTQSQCGVILYKSCQ